MLPNSEINYPSQHRGRSQANYHFSKTQANFGLFLTLSQSNRNISTTTDDYTMRKHHPTSKTLRIDRSCLRFKPITD